MKYNLPLGSNQYLCYIDTSKEFTKTTQNKNDTINMLLGIKENGSTQFVRSAEPFFITLTIHI